MGDSDVLRAERDARAALRRALDDLDDAEVAAGVRRRAPRWPTVLVTCVALAAVVAAGVGLWTWWSAARTVSDEQFRVAAIERVSVLLSPDHRQPDQVKRILSGASGIFYDEFAQSADSYSAFVRSQGTIAQGAVDGAAVSARADDEATVLVAAHIRFTAGGGSAPADAAPDGEARSFRLRVLVVGDDGVFTLGAVQYLP